MPRVRNYLSALAPRLGRAAWTLEAGALINAIGSGVVLPFTIIYLHNVRGFSLGVAGLIVATFGLVTFCSTPLAGAAIDAIGAKATLTVSLMLLALGYGLFPLITTPWHGFAFMAIAGVGNGGFWPSQSTLLSGLVDPARRSSAFAVQRVALNLGLAAGGIAGGLIATTSDPETFRRLFLINAASFLAYAAALVLVPAAKRRARPADAEPPRYRDVLRDRPVVVLFALNVVYASAAYGLFEAVMAPFAKNEAGVSEKVIGIVFFVNMMTVVFAQLPVTKALEGRPRMPALAAVAVIWSVSWLLILATGLWLEALAAAVVLVVATFIFSVGECLHGPTLTVLVADMAPERLRGRYMALVTNTYALGFAIGPGVGGFLLATSPVALWLGAIFVLIATGLGMLALEQALPRELRVVPRSDRGQPPVEAHQAPKPLAVGEG